MSDYPIFVYASPGAHEAKGGTYRTLSVDSDQALAEALRAGHFLTVEEAITGKSATPVIEDETEDNGVAPTRDELEAKARELGIKFTTKTTDLKLGELIIKAIES
jgi:hypothetical protein